MNQQDPEPPAASHPVIANLKLKLILAGIALVVAGLIFLLGFFPMWYQARQRTQERDFVARQLSLSQMQLGLAEATIDARRGDYEPARQEASRFFTELRAEVDQGAGSALNADQRGKMDPIFAERDEVVTLLARNDPAAADRLSNLFAAYRKAIAIEGISDK